MGWVEERAQCILARSPGMGKLAAYALAEQQAQKLAMGFTPGSWRAQAGFTPKGMITPAQKLQKSMGVAKFNPDKGLAPLNIKVGSIDSRRLNAPPTQRPMSTAPPNPRFAVKKANIQERLAAALEKQGFTVSQYSGPLNPRSIKHQSGAPPFTAPPLKVSGSTAQKTAGMATPALRLSASKAVGAPRVTPMPGPSIAQIAKPVGFGKPMPGAVKAPSVPGIKKVALLERLVRLAATPVPNTPKLLMKVRSPAELLSLQQTVSSGWDSKVTQPLLSKLRPLAEKLPEGKLRRAGNFVAGEVAKDPVGGAYTVLGPGGALYPPLKKGLERAIDHVAPLPG